MNTRHLNPFWSVIQERRHQLNQHFGKNYSQTTFNDTIQHVKGQLRDRDFYVMVDESTDVQGRAIAGVLIGVLDGTNRKPYLVEVAELERTDSVLIGQLVNNTLANLFNVIPYDKFKLFISDAASYMILAADRMKSGFYPNLVHITCLAHRLNRLAEFVRSKPPVQLTILLDK